jgi:hypothetical protein
LRAAKKLKENVLSNSFTNSHENHKTQMISSSKWVDLLVLRALFIWHCPGGGTGRRAGFKIQFWQQSAGSIPAFGTK